MGLVVMSQVLLILEHLVAVLAFKRVVVLKDLIKVFFLQLHDLPSLVAGTWTEKKKCFLVDLF